MAELLASFEPEIESITLIPSKGGSYEITLNGKLIYSKLSTGRHADPGEVASLLDKFLKDM